MKKGKIIALALAAGITFMGAGYAAWTDSVEINTTVATGNLDVDFENTDDTDNKKFETGTNEGLDLDDQKDKNKCSLSMGNLYPGIELESDQIQLVGVGSVTAILSPENTTVKLFLTKKNEEEKEITNDSFINYSILVKKENENKWNEIGTKLEGNKIILVNNSEILNIFTIAKGDKVDIKIAIKLESGAGNDYEDSSIRLEFVPEFIQENMNQEISDDNDGNR